MCFLRVLLKPIERVASQIHISFSLLLSSVGSNWDPIGIRSCIQICSFGNLINCNLDETCVMKFHQRGISSRIPAIGKISSSKAGVLRLSICQLHLLLLDDVPWKDLRNVPPEQQMFTQSSGVWMCRRSAIPWSREGVSTWPLQNWDHSNFLVIVTFENRAYPRWECS